MSDTLQEILNAQPDYRIVYGARCCWWDSIDKAARGLPPTCPHCGGVLYEGPNEAAWWRGAEEQEAKEPGYIAMMRWARGTCYRTMTAMREAWTAAGKPGLGEK